MALNYAIFRSEPIYTVNDLAGIGSHNKREKQAYNSNPDIKRSKSKDNIELVPLKEKYVQGFYNITKEYRKQHEERMKTMREDRKKTFRQMLDKSKSVVADELLFTATHNFFKGMTREDIKKWADTCMEFVYEDLGYTKEQVLYSVVHMDEETPHVHCTVVPLVKKYDNRTKTEKLTISKKEYIKDKYHLSHLQDLLHKRLTEKGYDLERGIKGSNDKNLKTKEFKKATRYYEKKVTTVNERLDNAVNDFEEKMKTTKNIPFNKNQVVINKDTFDSMNKVVEESKNALELQPKLNHLFIEINDFTQSHQALEKKNDSLEKEISVLKQRNNKLTEDYKKLSGKLKVILEFIKSFFRKLLKIGNESTKEATVDMVKDFYDDKDFKKTDVYDIAIDTTKEQELFDYAKIYRKKEKKKERKPYIDTYEFEYEEEKTKDKDDFGMSL